MGESERLSHRTLAALGLIASRALVTGRGDEVAVVETRVAIVSRGVDAPIAVKRQKQR